jgi:hypothetical protein
MKTRGKKVKRERAPGMAFGELVRKLWQVEPEGTEPKATMEKLRKPAAKRKRIRRGQRTCAS